MRITTTIVKGKQVTVHIPEHPGEAADHVGPGDEDYDRLMELFEELSKDEFQMLIEATNKGE